MRRAALDIFVNRIALHPELQQSEDLRTFLQADEEVGYLDFTFLAIFWLLHFPPHYLHLRMLIDCAFLTLHSIRFLSLFDSLLFSSDNGQIQVSGNWYIQEEACRYNANV